MRKLRVAVLYGGRSGEHEVSLQSAASVITHLDRNRFEIVPVAIDKQGRWHLNDISLLERLPLQKNESPFNSDGRTFGDEGRARRSRQGLDKLWAVKSRGITAKLKVIGVPNFPARMFDLILAASSANAGVAPV